MKTQTYRVKWEIDIDARTPKAAAQLALAIMQDPYSTATVFDVAEPDGNQLTVDVFPKRRS